MAELTDEQREYYQEMFHDFDEDGSGFLDRDEVITLMQVCGANPTEEDVDNYFQEVDIENQDGKISFDEFCVFMTKSPADPEAVLRDAFAYMDKDGNGYLDRSEVEEALREYKDDEDLRQLLEKALNDDGKVMYDELARLMMNKES